MSTAAPLGGGKDEELEKKDEMDDDAMFTTLGEEDKSKPSVAPRWATRVFAADCLCRVIMLCENANKAHFDLALARSARLKNPKSNCVLLRTLVLFLIFCVRFDTSLQLKITQPRKKNNKHLFFYSNGQNQRKCPTIINKTVITVVTVP